LFLEEYLKQKRASSCKTTRSSLITIKRYMLVLAERLKYNVPDEFKYIWDDEKQKQKPVSIV